MTGTSYYIDLKSSFNNILSSDFSKVAVANIANNNLQKQIYWLFGKPYKLQALDKMN